jgi:hypothetical protein
MLLRRSVRRTSNRRVFHLASLIEANLPNLTDDLETGCVVSLMPNVCVYESCP